MGKISLVVDHNNNSDNNNDSNNSIYMMLDAEHTLHLTEVGSTLSWHPTSQLCILKILKSLSWLLAEYWQPGKTAYKKNSVRDSVGAQLKASEKIIYSFL